MEFEFDIGKSRTNKVKHGIDFVEAQRIWLDDMRTETPVFTQNEPRFLVVGLVGTKHWSAVITYRGGNVRLISVRRSRPKEVAIYEGRGV